MSTLDQYTDTDASDHARAKRRIARILADTTTREDAVSSTELAEAVGPAPTTVRDLIPEIRRERAMPIANAPGGGYYVVQDTDDLAEHLERIDDEIATRLERKQELTAAFNRNRVVGHE